VNVIHSTNVDNCIEEDSQRIVDGGSAKDGVTFYIKGMMRVTKGIEATLIVALKDS